MFEKNQNWGPVHTATLTEAQELSSEQKQRDLYETHRHRIFSVSYYMTANEVDAEAILTGTFVDAFDRAEQPDCHLVDQALLRELNERFPLQAAEPAALASDDEMGRGQVRRTDLEEAVGTLPPRERLIFLLRDVEGYAQARVAGLLCCEETEVARSLVSARIRMRNTLAAARRSAREGWPASA